jgi:hypothetical protein
MSKIKELFLELNKELKSRDINSELFEYHTNTEEEYLCYYDQTILIKNKEDKLEKLENIKRYIEDIMFNCQTALYAVEAVRRKINII